MRRHLSYLKYIIRHKWFVLVAGLRIGAPLWRLLVHDLSKFLPGEWIPYAQTFYNKDGSSAEWMENLPFDVAWLHHQKRNKHHWQYWILIHDTGMRQAIDMPMCYILEMVADWAGAGRAITGGWEMSSWYHANRDKMFMTDKTRQFVESLKKMEFEHFLKHGK